MSPPSRLRLLVRVAAVLVLVSAARPGLAGSWQLRKSLDIRTTGTSNLFLTETDQVSTNALSIRPGIYATRQGGRVSAWIAYAPSLNFYLDDSSLDRVAHELNARVDAEIIGQYFFLSADARAGQVLNDPLSRASFDVINNPDAFSNTFSFSIRPDFRGPLLQAGRYARFRIQPGVNYSFTEGGLDGTVGRTTRASVFSGPAFSRIPWSLNYGNDIFDVDTDDGLGRLDGTIGFRINDEWRTDLTLGWDDGRFESDSETSGFRWRSTFTWAPNPRSRVSFGVGEAFFGNDWVLNLSHRHKHSAWYLSYDRNLENARQELLQEEFILLVDEFGEPILDPVAGLPLALLVSTPVQIDDVYLRDRLEARWSWFRGRTSAYLRARVDRRDYQSLALDETDARVTADLSRRLAPKTSGSANLEYWNHSEQTSSVNDFKQYALSMRLSYQLSRYLRVGVRYTFTERTSDSAGGGFDDNQVNFDFAFNFNRQL